VNNTLVGGRSKAEMDATTGGGGNEDGQSYGAMVPSLALFENFFATFPALPGPNNTGVGYNAAAWSFSLNSPPGGVVNGGNAAYYGLVSGGVTTDVAGSPRVQGGAPDMGAYESTLAGVPVPTYTVSNLKPQSASSTHNGFLTVNVVVQVAGAEVTVTATASSGYTAGPITCSTASGAPVSITNGKFIMPAENVTVDARFTSGVSGGGGFGP
jgi:hypothetical protein